MSQYWLIGICAAVFVIQLAVCFLSRRIWLRLLPVIVTVLATGGCFALYTYQANWAWLIFMAFSFQAAVMAAAAWLVYGLYRLVKKCMKV